MAKSRLDSLYGSLAKYADPELRKKEDTAWADAAAEKYLARKPQGYT